MVDDPQLSKRRRLAPAQRRLELLEALRAELDDKSFHDITVPGLAERARVSQGLFYRYFADLDTAFIALVEERLTPRLALSATRLRLDCVDSETVEGHLVAWFEDLASLIEDEGALLRAALLAAPTATGAAADHCRGLIERMREWGELLLRAVQGKPPYRAVDARHVSQMVVGMTLQCALLGLGGRSRRAWAREMGCFEAWGLMGRAKGSHNELVQAVLR